MLFARMSHVEMWIQGCAVQQGRRGVSTEAAPALRRVAPEIGARRLRDIDYETMVRIFGKMRRAGLSRSRMNNAKSLYQPLFAWAERLRVIRRSPMVGFKMPKSSQVARSRTPPEVDQVCLLLGTAVEKTPDVAPCSPWGRSPGCGGAS